MTERFPRVPLSSSYSFHFLIREADQSRLDINDQDTVWDHVERIFESVLKLLALVDDALDVIIDYLSWPFLGYDEQYYAD